MRLVCKNLYKKYGEKVVYEDAELTVTSGKIYGFLGRNGVGKTTLFNCLSNADSFDFAHIFLIDDYGNERRITEKDVGYVLSTPELPEFMTGYEFVDFYMKINEKRGDVSYYLDLVNISKEDRGKLIKDYSLGMKNKIQLLMPVISQPPVILLDEPLTSFDIIVAEEMKDLLAQLKKNKIIILSTHIMQLAEEMCDALIFVRQHRLEVLEKSLKNDIDTRKIIIEKLNDEV